jgi:hypothetical protein
MGESEYPQPVKGENKTDFDFDRNNPTLLTFPIKKCEAFENFLNLSTSESEPSFCEYLQKPFLMKSLKCFFMKIICRDMREMRTTTMRIEVGLTCHAVLPVKN